MADRPLTQQDYDRYRADKLRRLQRDVDYLKGEETRLYTLLVDACRCASHNQDFDEYVLLEALAARRGMNLTRAHIYDQAAA